jgi:hypothetical protein
MRRLPHAPRRVRRRDASLRLNHGAVAREHASALAAAMDAVDQ